MNLVAGTKLRGEVRIDIRGLMQAMQKSLESFAIGLSLAAVLLHRILVAQTSRHPSS
jgi:hypothetical protein